MPRALVAALALTSQASAEPVPVTVSAKPIDHFALSEPSRTRFGLLDFRGGLVLTPSDSRFSSLSGLVLGADGRAMLAVSDFGLWVAGTITEDARGRPTGLEDVVVAPMLGPDGKPLGKRRGDAEAIVRLSRDTVLVSLEGTSLARFAGDPPFDIRAAFVPRPPNLVRLPRNLGIEALAAAPAGSPLAGRIVAFGERAGADGLHPGAMLADGRWRPIALVGHDNFAVTDAAFLPGGDLLVLERRYDRPLGLYMRLRRIGVDDLRGTAPLDGPILMEADFGDEIDNMEGLAVHVTPAGETLLTVVSDDNRSIFQRTLILRFALSTPMPRARPQTGG